MCIKRSINKIISLLIIILFIILSSQQCFAELKTNDISFSLCYGFIIPSDKYDNKTFENQIYCKVLHLINDLLREKITVYWTISNITASVIDINDIEKKKELHFEKGSFIVPFAGKEKIDAKISAIICDYNRTSEIETKDNIKLHTYVLLNNINSPANRLFEVKIAQFHDVITGGEEHYLEIARNCGFLNFDFITEKIIKNTLDNTKYNLLIYGGSCTGYSSFHNALTASSYQLREDIIYDVANKIRKFVVEGGGYIGSCGGAERASSGFYLGNIAINFDKKVYNTNLKTYGIIALSDAVFKINLNWTGIDTEVKIINQSHPVSYGLGEICYDKYAGGPHFLKLGENSQIIALFNNFKIDSMNDTPCWVSSKFGNGKVIIYSTHPETLVWKEGAEKANGNRILSNSIYYTTSEKVSEINLFNSVTFSFIENIWNKTNNLNENIDKTEAFNDIKNRINKTIAKFSKITNKIEKLLSKVRDYQSDITNNFLGYNSIHEAIFYINLLKIYLENAIENFNIFEDVYPLLYVKPNFVKNVNMLNSSLNNNMNETKKICSKLINLCNNYENKLIVYSHCRMFPFKNLIKIFGLLVKETAFKIYKEGVKVFHYVPKIYFDSLKCLRTNWYNYEAEIVIE